MPSTAEIQNRIAAIISDPKNVSFSEIKWVMDSLGATERACPCGRLFRLGQHRVTISLNKNGENKVPKYSVDEFRDLMIDLELF